mgnify:CR=1 FL=1
MKTYIPLVNGTNLDEVILLSRFILMKNPVTLIAVHIVKLICIGLIMNFIIGKRLMLAKTSMDKLILHHIKIICVVTIRKREDVLTKTSLQLPSIVIFIYKLIHT